MFGRLDTAHGVSAGTKTSENDDNQTKPVAGTGGRNVYSCSGKSNVGDSGGGILKADRPLYVDFSDQVSRTPETALGKVKAVLKIVRNAILHPPCCYRTTEDVGDCDSMADSDMDSTVVRQAPAASTGEQRGSLSGGDDGVTVFSVTDPS